jgi:large subunit ribosomal protein L31
MKPNIHPKYKEIKVTCSCGNTFTTGSAYEGDELHLEICSNCHPFYTGQQKIVDTAKRVDRFRQKYSSKPVKERPSEGPKVKEKVVKKGTKKASAKKASKVTQVEKSETEQ